MRRLLIPAFITSTVAWALLLGVAPLLPVPLAGILYGFGSLICHQISARSFHLGAVQFPVCARCLGIYAGLALAGLSVALARPRTIIARTGGQHPRLLLLLGAMPILVTVGAEWAGIWQPANVVRALSGAVLGCAVSLVVIGALTTLHYEQCAPRRPIAPPPRRTPF